MDEETPAPEDVDKPQNIVLVGDPEVGADLLALEVLRVHAHEDLELVFQGLEHRDLVVGREPGKHARGVVVVEELATHLQVELAADGVAALGDVLRLHLNVLIAIKSYFHVPP